MMIFCTQRALRKQIQLAFIRFMTVSNLVSLIRSDYNQNATKRKAATLRKHYFTDSEHRISSCRLCLSVGDLVHRQRLFAPCNSSLLQTAETLVGEKLVEDNLPELICRPCVRHLKNIATFIEWIRSSQETMKMSSKVTSKRCLPESVEKPPAKSRTLPSVVKAKRLIRFSNFCCKPEGIKITFAL